MEPWVNDGGDVSFIGHIAGEESVVAGFPPQADLISALGGLYVKEGGTGKIHSVVHPGDPAPGGGDFRAALHDVMNNRGDIAFNGELSPSPSANQNIGAHRTVRSKGCLSNRTAIAMIFKLARAAEKSWRHVSTVTASCLS